MPEPDETGFLHDREGRAQGCSMLHNHLVAMRDRNHRLAMKAPMKAAVKVSGLVTQMPSGDARRRRIWGEDLRDQIKGFVCGDTISDDWLARRQGATKGQQFGAALHLMVFKICITVWTAMALLVGHLARLMLFRHGQVSSLQCSAMGKTGTRTDEQKQAQKNKPLSHPSNCSFHMLHSKGPVCPICLCVHPSALSVIMPQKQPMQTHKIARNQKLPFPP